MIRKFDFNYGGYVSIKKDGVKTFYTHTPPSYPLFLMEKAFSAAQIQNNNFSDLQDRSAALKVRFGRLNLLSMHEFIGPIIRN